MRLLMVLALLFSLGSCWIKPKPGPNPYYGMRVWGNKPIYDATVSAKKITYSNTPKPVVVPGNIYVKDNFIYQLEIGKGIHVIDNSDPSLAHRVGFITINGSSQISIKGNYLYSNSYDDLVVVDISNITGNTVTEVSRASGALPQGRYDYYYVEPPETGYYECPTFDSVVIGWRKDSIWAQCSKY